MAKRYQTGLTAKVRKAAGVLKFFTAKDLNNEINILTYKEAQRVRTIIQDLKKTGEIYSVRPGFYEYVQKERKRTLLDVVWHLVRSHRHFSLAEIERFSGAAHYTAKEYLQCLTKLGYLEKTDRYHWKLVKDPGPNTPTNTAKCERLRNRRSQGGGYARS